MTVYVNIGRRLPRSWLRRTAVRAKGLMTFQENMWMMIKQSMSMAKRKANADGRLKFLMRTEDEVEDLNYQIEWLRIVIQGTEEQEEEEYNEALEMYKPFGKLFKGEMPQDERMGSHFRTKILTSAKVEEAYKAGYGAVSDNNIANKLLELGILTHIEWQKDFDIRKNDIKPDF